MKKLNFCHLCRIFIFTFSLLASSAPGISFAQQNPEQLIIDIQKEFKNIPEGSIVPVFTNGLEEAEIEKGFRLISNQQPGKETFLSFVSDRPSEEELRRVQKTEQLARIDGYKVERIVIPINEVTGKPELELKELKVKDNVFSALNKVKTYIGSFKSNVDKKPQDLRNMPTPVERKMAIFQPLKNSIIKPIAWSAHTGAVGVAAVTLLSVTYSYFISVYWHAFRVYFNTPHGLQEGSKLGKVLEKINLAELAEKLRIKSF